MMSDLQRHGLSDKLQFVAIPDKIVLEQRQRSLPDNVAFAPL